MNSTGNTAATPIRQVNCPTCQKIVPWTRDNPHLPFCCRQCKLLDFGEWASERHRIAGEPVSGQDSEDEFE